MSTELKQRLEAAKKRVDAAKEQKLRLEARMAELQRTEAQQTAECQRRGLDPNQLPQEIATREQRINELLERIDQLLPADGSAPKPTAPAAPASEEAF